jgi:hypothetical protein
MRNSIIVRFINEKGELDEKLLGFSRLSGMDANAIFSTIEDAIQNLGLDLNCLMGHFFTAQK